ncbi:hypothetical protein BKA83DRAFT_4127026 [Pisolithus microcarpus]|nr:hypothetical protein BKA83DRAFT_4127026 [Pisolithus microcarpus]
MSWWGDEEANMRCREESVGKKQSRRVNVQRDKAQERRRMWMQRKALDLLRFYQQESYAAQKLASLPDEKRKSPQENQRRLQAEVQLVGVKVKDSEALLKQRGQAERKREAEEREEVGAKAILDVLDKIEDVVKDTPPTDNKASRFGNPAFRMFYDKVVDLAPSLHATLPHFPEDATNEISAYFVDAWGNRERIDYGSGMELLCWLSHSSVLAVTGILQSTYWLELSGSHGVWGLNDYHFLPFLFGSAQLRGHKYLRPKAIYEAVDELVDDYMYFVCIKFIDSVCLCPIPYTQPSTTTPLHLKLVTRVRTWHKVNAGMTKMYKAEVPGKFPVMHHFLFGSNLLRRPRQVTSVHTGDTSTKDGEKEERKMIEGPGIRPISFD